MKLMNRSVFCLVTLLLASHGLAETSRPVVPQASKSAIVTGTLKSMTVNKDSTAIEVKVKGQTLNAALTSSVIVSYSSTRDGKKMVRALRPAPKTSSKKSMRLAALSKSGTIKGVLRNASVEGDEASLTIEVKEESVKFTMGTNVRVAVLKIKDVVVVRSITALPMKTK